MKQIIKIQNTIYDKYLTSRKIIESLQNNLVNINISSNCYYILTVMSYNKNQI